MKGLYFYKLISKYSEDVTKNCKLTVNEIDSNFYTLKEADIISGKYDTETMSLILTRVGGEQIVEPERKSEWKLNLKDTDGLTDAEIKHLDNMMVMETIDDNTISIHPKRAKTLIGHTFTLTVTDMTGESRSTIDVEVIG